VGLSVSDEFIVCGRAEGGAPACNPRSLAALFHGKVEGKVGGGLRLLIGAGEGKERAGNKREFNRGVTAGGARLLARDPDRGGRWV
jgi:hypothetical protein